MAATNPEVDGGLGAGPFGNVRAPGSAATGPDMDQGLVTLMNVVVERPTDMRQTEQGSSHEYQPSYRQDVTRILSLGARASVGRM
jgi:hypothetical protein